MRPRVKGLHLQHYAMQRERLPRELHEYHRCSPPSAKRMALHAGCLQPRLPSSPPGRFPLTQGPFPGVRGDPEIGWPRVQFRRPHARSRRYALFSSLCQARCSSATHAGCVAHLAAVSCRLFGTSHRCVELRCVTTVLLRTATLLLQFVLWVAFVLIRLLDGYSKPGQSSLPMPAKKRRCGPPSPTIPLRDADPTRSVAGSC